MTTSRCATADGAWAKVNVQRMVSSIVWLAAALALVLCIAGSAHADAGGNPRIHVDDVLGSDSNSGLHDTDPVTTSNGRWSRVEQLGIFGADTGIVATRISDTPTAHWAREAMKEKPDRVQRVRTREVIPGHGQLPDEDIEESEIAGIRVRTKYLWETFVAPNGRLSERQVPNENAETVEAY